MKQGKTITELAMELERQTKTKKDFVAPTSAIKMQDDGKTITVGEYTKNQHRDEMAAAEAADDRDELRRLLAKPLTEGIFSGSATNHAHSQIAARLKIPMQYYRKMQADAPDLLAANVNRWFNQNPERRMVRTLDDKVRAVMSDKYRPLDNYDLAEATLGKLAEMEVEVQSCEVTDARMYIKGTTKKIEAEAVGDVIRAGIVISNSETGQGTLRVEPLLYYLSCLNGMVSQDYSLRKYHVGRKGNEGGDWAEEFYKDETRKADDRAFFLKVRDVVSGTLSENIFKKIVGKVEAAAGRPIDGKLDEVIEVVAETYDFNEDEKDSILQHLIKGKHLNQFGLQAAVTRASQDIEDYDRATEFEAIGGKIVELGNSEWERLLKKSA